MMPVTSRLPVADDGERGEPGAAGSGGLMPRRGTESDLQSVRDVVASAYARYLDRMDRPPAPVLNDYRAATASGQVWVLGEPVFGVIVLISQGDALLIENVAVAPAAQGQGFGRTLMEFAERQALAQGLCELTLYTNEIMTENLELYARLGFREVSRRAEDGYRRVYMEKIISP
jgi:ribosomal protein S18 acetylase RimI-like enzyme